MVSLNAKSVKEFKDALELLRYLKAHQEEIDEVVEIAKWLRDYGEVS